jgi:hypothetical protein
MNPESNTPKSPRIRLYRDPRDLRELLTDTLGVTVESTTQEARAGYDASTSTSNLLGQRKRERAWAELNDPINRLLQETLLYPVEPIPEPDDPDFPVYDPQLPEPPVIHETQSAMDRLLDAVAKALPPRPEPPAPEFRDVDAQTLPPLPDPVFGDE